MITAYKFTNIKTLLFGPLALLLASCGSYEYAGYENDGIYSPNNTGSEEAYAEADYEEHEDSYEDALYYKNLFGEKSNQFGNIAQEGLIFTDVEGYTSTGSYDDDAALLETELAYTGGHGAWGSSADRISVNIYNDPFYSSFYHPYHNPFYGGFYPYRGYGYGYGWNDWGWNYGFGYGGYGYGGYGYYNPWRWSNPGWHRGWAYNPYRYGGYYSSPYFFGDRYAYRDVAYNQSRRNSVLDFDDDYNRSNSTARASRVEYADARSARVDRGSDYRVRSNRSDDRTYRTRTSRAESPRSERRSVYRRSNDSDSSPVRVRTTRRARSNNDTYTRSRSTTRSSGTIRSSSGSTRSSGTTRSSSRSSRGRGR